MFNYSINPFLIILLCRFLNVYGYTYHSEVGVYYKAHEEQVSWLEAKRICESENATLAMPRDVLEVEIIKSYNLTWTHLGFHRFYGTKAFTSFNGDALQYYYNIWRSNEPENYKCVQMYLGGNVAVLVDIICDHKYTADRDGMFACQRRHSQREKHSDSRCPTNDSEYRYAEGIGKCYKIHMNALEFYNANTTCKVEGGNLAIIGNNEEKIFLTTMFNEPKYTVKGRGYLNNPNLLALGIQNIFGTEHYTTVHDQKWTFAGWIPDKVDQETILCLALSKEGEFVTFPCYDYSLFACEISGKENTKTIEKSIGFSHYNINNSTIYVYNSYN